MSLDSRFFTPDTGDTVLCRGVRQAWTVACVEQGSLSWCGWPEGRIAVGQCQLIKKATRTAKQHLLRRWAAVEGADHRGRYARRAIMGGTV